MSNPQDEMAPYVGERQSADDRSSDDWVVLWRLIVDIEGAIDREITSFSDEDLRNVQRCISCLKAFVHCLPDRAVSKVFRASEFTELEKCFMHDW